MTSIPCTTEVKICYLIIASVAYLSDTVIYIMASVPCITEVKIYQFNYCFSCLFKWCRNIHYGFSSLYNRSENMLYLLLLQFLKELMRNYVAKLMFSTSGIIYFLKFSIFTLKITFLYNFVLDLNLSKTFSRI